MRSLLMPTFLSVALSLCSEAATVIVISTPKGADVLVDGKPAGRTPFRKSLTEGAHQLTLKKAEHQDLVHTVQVGKKLVVLRLDLKPKTYPVDIVFEDVTEAAMDWHVFANNGTHLGTAPGTFEFPKGKVKLLLVKEGFKDVPIVAEVTGEPQVVTLENPKPGKSSWSRLSLFRFVGCWVKVDTGTKLHLFDDMNYRLDGHDGNGWKGEWKVTPATVEIQAFGGPLTLTLQKDGTLQGRSRNGMFWQMKKVGGAADAAGHR